jgi:YggT family protein
MNRVLQQIFQQSILHHIIPIVAGALSLMILIYVIISWIPPWREGKFGRFMSDLVSPIVGPFDRLIPPINLGGMSLPIGFIVGWWSIGIVAALIWQSLPAGW